MPSMFCILLRRGKSLLVLLFIFICPSCTSDHSLLHSMFNHLKCESWQKCINSRGADSKRLETWPSGSCPSVSKVMLFLLECEMDVQMFLWAGTQKMWIPGGRNQKRTNLRLSDCFKTGVRWVDFQWVTHIYCDREAVLKKVKEIRKPDGRSGLAGSLLAVRHTRITEVVGIWMFALR